jgi:mono/diheme cytochrome c family protein
VLSRPAPAPRFFPRGLRGLGAALLSLVAAGAAPDFEREVQPVLAAHCLKCHGPEKQKGGYRVDVKAIALTGGEGSAPNLLPGNAAGSPLFRYVSGADPELRMPPAGEPPLAPAEVAVLWARPGPTTPVPPSLTRSTGGR